MIQRLTAQRKEEFDYASLAEKSSGSRCTTALISSSFAMLFDNESP